MSVYIIYQQFKPLSINQHFAEFSAIAHFALFPSLPSINTSKYQIDARIDLTYFQLLAKSNHFVVSTTETISTCRSQLQFSRLNRAERHFNFDNQQCGEQIITLFR